MRTKEIKTIDVNAKEWFDKVNGNSYFSCKVIINMSMDNEKILLIPFQYGYGNQFEYAAFKKLKEVGIFSKKEYFALFRACEENKIILRTHKEVNCKKRDLYGGLKSHNAIY